MLNLHSKEILNGFYTLIRLVELSKLNEFNFIKLIVHPVLINPWPPQFTILTLPFEILKSSFTLQASVDASKTHQKMISH